MKKIPQGLEFEYGPIRIFKDDILDISKILEGNCKSISIKTDKFEYDSFDELVKNSNKIIKILNIRSSNPHISISLQRYNCSINIWEDDPSSIGMGHQINSILNRCQVFRNNMFSMRNYFYFLGVVMFFSIGSAIYQRLYGTFDSIGHGLFSLFIFAVFVLWNIGMIFFHFRFFIAFPTEERFDRRFLVKYGPQIVTGVFSFITASIFFLAGLFLYGKKLMP